MSTEQAVLASVVIVTYNSASQIPACLESLNLELQGCTSQIIVVDNHSLDQTRKLVLEYAGSNPAIELRCKDRNVGFTRALNEGLRGCTGRYIFILNPDTCLAAGCFSKLQRVLSAQDDAGIVAPQLLNPDSSVQPSCRRFPRRQDLIWELTGLSHVFSTSKRFNHWKMGDFDHLTSRAVDQPQGACLFFPAVVLEQVGLWDEQFPMFFSDVDWCLRVKKAGYKIYFEPAAKVVHLKGASVFQHRAKMLWTSHRSFYHYMVKHKQSFVLVNELLGIILWLVCLLRICVIPFEQFARNRRIS